MITREEFNSELRKACIKYASFDIKHVATLLDPDAISQDTIKKIDAKLDEIVNSVGPMDKNKVQDEINLRMGQLIFDTARGRLGRGGRRAKFAAKRYLVRALEKNEELFRQKKLFYVSPDYFEKFWNALGFSEMSHEIMGLLEKQKKGDVEKQDPFDLLVGTPAPTQQNIQPQEAHNEHI